MGSGYNKGLYNKVLRERKKSRRIGMVGDIAGSLISQAPYWYGLYRQDQEREQNDEAVRNLSIRHPELGFDPSELKGVKAGDLAAILLKQRMMDSERDYRMKNETLPMTINGAERNVPFDNVDDVGRYLNPNQGNEDPMLPLHVGGTDLEGSFGGVDEQGNVMVPKSTFNTALPLIHERAGANAREKARAALLSDPGYQTSVDDTFLAAAGLHRPSPPPMAPTEPSEPMPGPPYAIPEQWVNYLDAKQSYDQEMEVWRRNVDAFDAKSRGLLGQGQYMDPSQVNARLESMRRVRQGDALQKLRELAESNRVDADTKRSINQFLESAFLYQDATGAVNLPQFPGYLAPGAGGGGGGMGRSPIPDIPDEEWAQYSEAQKAAMIEASKK